MLVSYIHGVGVGQWGQQPALKQDNLVAGSLAWATSLTTGRQHK